MDDDSNARRLDRGTEDDDAQERTVAERFVAGEDADFRVGFERYVPILRARVFRSLSRKLERKVSVADILQEVQIVAHRRRGSFTYRGPGSLAAWLLAITDLKLRETIRHHAATAKRAVDREAGGVSGHALADPGPTPSQQAIARETASQMRRAREQLSPDQTEVLRLVQEQQLTLAEVAQRLGRSRETVKRIYGRGIVRFKATFDRIAKEHR